LPRKLAYLCILINFGNNLGIKWQQGLANMITDLMSLILQENAVNLHYVMDSITNYLNVCMMVSQFFFILMLLQLLNDLNFLIYVAPYLLQDFIEFINEDLTILLLEDGNADVLEIDEIP